jgi:glycosyltransferase involved in cell wall biosynthesis
MSDRFITVLCNTRFPSTAAHSGYLARLCESFARQGISVELVVPKRFKEVKANSSEYYSVKSPFSVRKIWSFDFLILGSVLGRLAYILQYANFYVFVLCFFLFRSRKRVVYIMDNLGGLLHFLGYRLIFETHVGIGSYRKYFLPLLKKAERFVAVNSIIKNDFVMAGFPAEKILVAPNGVDLDVFSGQESKEELRRNLKLPIGAKIIAYIGKYKTMGMDKGVDALVQAFGSVSQKIGEAHLLVVGLSDGEKNELTAVLEHSGVAASLYTLVEHRPQPEVARFMRASDVLVMNYPNTPYYRSYMSPMKMFEYMASGTPIVTSDLPAIREILDEKTAVFVLPDNQASLEQGILKVLNEEEFAGQIAGNARKEVLNHTWEKRAEKILNFIGV